MSPARGLAFALALGLTGCGSTVRRGSQFEHEYPAGVAQLRWHTVLHERGQFDAHPEECAAGAVVGKRLVIGSRSGKVVGVDVADGRIVWSTPISGGVESEARHDEARHLVYLGSDDGFVYAIDPASGAVRWSYKGKGAIERRPEIGGDAVYVSTATDRVFALEAATGKWRWQYEREAPEGFTIHGHSGPRLHEGIVYEGFSDGYLVALQATSGEVLWARSLAGASDQFVDVDATTAIVGDAIIASSYSGGLFSLRARDGQVRWHLPIEGASALGVTDQRLYVAAPRDGLAALTPDGQVLWRQGLAEAGDLTAPFAVGPYLIFSGSRAGLFIVDRATGKLLQVFNPGRGACAPATVDAEGKNLYLLANSGALYALRLGY